MLELFGGRVSVSQVSSSQKTPSSRLSRRSLHVGSLAPKSISVQPLSVGLVPFNMLLMLDGRVRVNWC
jgi:hypothetical protein